MANLNADPETVKRLLNQQQLQKYAADNAPGHDEVELENSTVEIESEGKKIVDKVKPTQKVTEWLVLAPITVSLPHVGPVHFRSGSRINSPHIHNELVAAGAKLKPIVG